jgi:hypothetical protein
LFLNLFKVHFVLFRLPRSCMVLLHNCTPPCMTRLLLMMLLALLSLMLLHMVEALLTKRIMPQSPLQHLLLLQLFLAPLRRHLSCSGALPPAGA